MEGQLGRFLERRPSKKAFVEGSRGANLWIVVPADDAVLVGARMVEGAPCVHPLQAYLDLKAHPERAAEAAARLRPLVLGRASVE